MAPAASATTTSPPASAAQGRRRPRALGRRWRTRAAAAFPRRYAGGDQRGVVGRRPGVGGGAPVRGRDRRRGGGGIADRLGEVLGGGEAFLGPLRQRLGHHGIELRRHGRPGQRRQHRLDVERLLHDGGHAALERPFAGEHLVEDDTRGPDVGPVVGRIAPELLGRHIGGRAEHGADMRHRGILDPRDPEIGDLHHAVLGQHDVRGLDVAMHHAARMGVGEGVQDLAHQPDDHRRRQPLLLVEHGLEGLALDHLHDDPGDLGVFAVVEDGNDVRMREAAGGPGALPEPGMLLRGGGAFVGRRQAEDLDGHPPADRAGVERLVDRRPRAGAEFSLELVPARDFPKHGSPSTGAGTPDPACQTLCARAHEHAVLMRA